MKFKSKNYSKAFSLIELITVIAIIGIMTGIAIVSLVPAKSSAKLDAAGREVASAIKLAQSYALQGKVAGGFVPCGYGVYVDEDANKYKIFYLENNDCEDFNKSSGDIDSADKTNKISETYTLKDGVKFSSDSKKSWVYYSVPHGNMFSGTKTIWELDFNGNKKNITIKSGGVVEEGAVQ